MRPQTPELVDSRLGSLALRSGMGMKHSRGRADERRQIQGRGTLAHDDRDRWHSRNISGVVCKAGVGDEVGRMCAWRKEELLGEVERFCRCSGWAH